MDVHRLFEVGGVHVLERPDLNHAGVVDENVEPAAVGDHLLDNASSFAALGEIADQDGDADATRFEIFARRIEFGGVTRRQSHVRAEAPEFTRDGEAQAS